VTAIYYDTEFLEAGAEAPLRLISIGLVAENGDELYRVALDPALMWAAVQHAWLRDNVVMSLPVKLTQAGWKWDTRHRDYGAVQTRAQIAADVSEFILAHDRPQLWADWGAYDHVALCQLWGSMAALPAGIPMWTHEFRQEVEYAGNPDLPALPADRAIGEHHALHDARELKFRREWLAEHCMDGKPRWPSMRVVRDLDDFEVVAGFEGSFGLRCPDRTCMPARFPEELGSERLGTLIGEAYQHVDGHTVAGR
jgi:hypothetical protein